MGGVAAALLVISMLTVKLEFPGHGGLTASPRSACSYSGEPPAQLKTQIFNHVNADPEAGGPAARWPDHIAAVSLLLLG